MADLRRADSRRTPAVLGGLLAVAVTAGALAAASAHTPKLPRQGAAESSHRTSRTMVCSSTPAQSSLVAGAVGGAVKRTEATATTPTLVRAPAGAATTAYAVQSARGATWFTAQGCVEPSAEQWFLGAGGSSLHRSTLQLTNTRSGQAVVDVEVWDGDGPVEAPGLRGIPVGRTPVSLDLSKAAPALNDLVVRVNTTRGLVAASLTDLYTPSASAKTTTEWLPGISGPATELTLGGLGESGSWTLMVFNGGEDSAVAEIDYVGETGTFAPTGLQPVTAAPGELTEIALPRPGGQPVQGIRLRADRPLVAAVRSRVGQDVLYTQQLLPIGTRVVAGLPEQSRAQLRFINPNSDAAASFTVRLLDAKSKELDVVSAKIRAGAALKLTPPALTKGSARVVVVQSSQPLLGWIELSPTDAIRASLPLRSVAGEVNVPAVRSGG